MKVIAMRLLSYDRVVCSRCGFRQSAPPDVESMSCRNCDELLLFKFCGRGGTICDNRADVHLTGEKPGDERVVNVWICWRCYEETSPMLGASVEVFAI